MFNSSKIILAIALFSSAFLPVNAGIQSPVLNVGLKQFKMGDGVQVDSLVGALEANIESQVADGVTCGASFGFGETNPLKSFAARVVSNVMGRKFDADLSFDVESTAFTGDVKLGSGGSVFKASVDTSGDGLAVEKMQYTRKGNGWRVQPTLHAKDFELDLEAETNLGDANTNALVSVNNQGEGHVKVSKALDGGELATVSFEASSGLEDVKLGVSKVLNGGMDRLATTFHAASKHMTLDWTHKLGSSGSDRQIIASVDQGSQLVDLTLESVDDINDWAVKVSTPWNNLKDADFSIGRKVSIGSLAGMKLPSVRAKGE